MNKIGIIGNGFVGNAVFEGLRGHYMMYSYDIDESKRKNSLDEINTQTEVVFLCVPTPMSKTGDIDISILHSVIKKLYPGKILIVKSTVTPSAALQLIKNFPQQNLVFNPEFLTEKTAVNDFKEPSRIVLGGDEKYTKEVENIYKKVFHTGGIEFIKTDAKTACFIKYFSNCFFAAKVSLMNEFRQVSDAAGIDWNIALRGLLTSGWVNPMHTLVPGPDGDYGFGGKCFPKDINAFIEYSQSLDVDTKLLKSAWEKNLEVRKDKNWLHIPGAVSKNKRKKK